ncbi:MAG: tetratricopeptide repeat protein, partial [Anaerolineae bacterium]|nr:tetratricopeptide repeat protein [Anaerolineae bacterium]
QTNEVCDQALALYQQLGDRSGEATIYNNQAMSCFARKSYDEALAYAQRALELAEEINHIRLTTSVHATIGEIYAEMESFSQAEPHLQTSLALARQHQIAYIEMYSQLLLGRMCNQQHNPQAARPYLQAALTLAEQISVRQDTAVCHQALTQTYQLLGDFAQALTHFEAFHRIQQEIFNDESDQRLRSLQVIHQTKHAQQEAEIYQLRNVALQQEIAERQRAETALQKANKQLQRQNEELDAYAHTVAHDLKQPLTAVGMYADMLTQFGDRLSAERQMHTIGQMKRAGERAIRIVG